LEGRLQKWLSTKQKVKFDDCNFINVRLLGQRLFASLRVTGKDASDRKTARLLR